MKLTAAVLCLWCAAANAQIAFEVASVKPTPPDRQDRLQTSYCTKDGSFSAGGVPVFWILKYAFQLKDYQITREPEWLHDFASAYDIEAKPSKLGTTEDCRKMLQALLAERFKLTTHRESKETSVYLLMPARGGPKLKDRGSVELNGAKESVNGQLRYPDGWTMAQLATFLSDFAGRPVVDQTGLSGTHGITLEFSRDDADTTRPSLFTAVQEQLGLRLEPGKAPVEVMAIDHIEKPSAN